MAEPTQTPENEEISSQPAEQACDNKSDSCCKPHSSLFISLLALALAGYAVFSATSPRDSSAIDARIGQLDQQLSDIQNNMTSLSQQVQSNRENLVQTQLKKALQNIQDISNLAGDSTRAAISQVEGLLKSLTADTEPATPEAAAPAESNAAEASPAADSTAVTQDDAATTPAAAMPADTTAAPQPAAAPAASPESTANPTADTTAGSTEAATTADTATPTEPQAAPAAEPTAPQAF